MAHALSLHAAGAAPDPYRDLREISERLCQIVDEYDDEPKGIVSGVLVKDDDETNVTSAVKQAYKLMKALINDPNSPLQAQPGVWAAFDGEMDGLSAIYGKAIDELESFKKLVKRYEILEKQLLSRGEPEKLDENDGVFLKRRRKCIDAVTAFSKKVAYMLSGL